MESSRSDIDRSPNEDERKSDEQFPVDTKCVTEVRLDTNDARGDVVRIVVMNDQATLQCEALREYHYGDIDISIEELTSFTLRSSTIPGTQQAIDGFVGSMALRFDASQPPTWTCGVYTPSAARKRLFKAADPDDSTKMIGVLIEQDSEGRLSRITWYKTQDASSLFHVTPDTLDFSVVRDENSAPSLDPNDIGGWTWYYTTSGAGGS